MLLSELDFALTDDGGIEDDLHILETLYYWEIFKCMHSIIAYHQFQAQLHCERVHLVDSEKCQICS